MHSKAGRWALVLMVVTLLALPFAARAQQTLGSINGTVVDSSGGVVQKAAVKIRNVGTGLEVTAETKDDGSYNVVDLPIGTYSVSFSKQGFKTEIHSEILVRGNLATTVNGALQPGEISATVTVTATPLLNQTDTTNGYTLSSEVIQSTPLGTGSFTQLAILSPGVNADLLSGSGTNAGLGNQNIWANGQRNTSNSFSFNGVNANNVFNGKSSSSVSSNRLVLNTGESFLQNGDIQTGTSIYNAIGQGLPTPPQETIEELRVNTSMYDTSQGANSGAHIEVTTKSGTNAYHGQLWEYHQTDAWNAAPFFHNADPDLRETGISPVPKLHRNTFGGTIGGPIVKNKLFFFTAYQGVRASDQNASFSFLALPPHLTNDRSAAALESVALQDFGANVTSVDPVSLALMQAKTPNGSLLIPTPNDFSAFAANNGFDTVVEGPASTFEADQVVGNIDYNFSSKDRLAGKYYFQHNPTTSPFAIAQVLGFTQSLNAGSQVVSLDNASTLTPNLTWEQKFGFIRESAFATTDQPFGPSGVGPGINLLGLSRFPGINIHFADTTIGSACPPCFDATEIGPGSGVSSTFNFANAGIFQNQWEGASNLNWVHGRHTAAAGFNWDHNQLNILNKNNQVAEFFFRNFATFLSGTLDKFRNTGRILNGETNRYYRSNQVGAYAQDNIKLRSNLTLNLGVRWDWDGPLSEKYGRLTSFYPSHYSYDLATDTINNIGLVVAGNNKQFCATKSSFCVNDSTLTGRQWFFQPRIGLAWSPSFMKNFVVRAGFGLYADRGEFFTELSPSAGLGISGPFGVTTEEPFTVPVANTCTGAGCLSNNPFGTTPLPPPPSNFSGVAALVHNQSQLSGCPEPVTPTCTPTNFFPPFDFLFGGYDPRNTLPYTENWTLDVQWQPFNSWLFTVGYVGNHGLHELLPIPFNEPLLATPAHPVNGQIYSYGFQATDAAGFPLATEQVQTTIGDFAASDGNTALRTPFIGFNPNSSFWEAEGVSHYNALQVGVNKRMSHGLLLTGSYTWSHSLDEGSGLQVFYNGNDPRNPRSAYGNSGFDRTHVFTISYLYQLPKASELKGFAGQIVNGWGISGVTVLESGQPYSVIDFSGAFASQAFAGDDFITNPIVQILPGFTTSSVQLQGTTGVNAGQPVLNMNGFGVVTLAPGQNGVPPCGPTTNPTPTNACDNFETPFSTTGRNIFRGPFQTQFNFDINKTFKFSERFSLQYDAQFFNLFNHPSFDAPNNNVTLNPCFSPSPCFLTPPYVGANALSPPIPGIISHTIGSPRFVQMALHLKF